MLNGITWAGEEFISPSAERVRTELTIDFALGELRRLDNPSPSLPGGDPVLRRPTPLEAEITGKPP
jgi:hypothetical protein